MSKIKSTPIIICSLYRFVKIDNPLGLKAQLSELLNDNAITGTLLVAREGVNGTVAGDRQAIDILQHWFNQDKRFAGILFKETKSFNQPFLRARVKLKKEIVAMGVNHIDPNNHAGTYVDPEDWNELISCPDVITIDTRNDYEIQIGSFKNAVNPATSSFRELPEYVAKHLAENRDQKIAMFCTGGIRCEKSTSYLKYLGFDNVYHLKGGILNYLEKIDLSNSLWEGECFVFDERVTVDHNLQPGSYDQCHACRRPISETDKESEHYERGVSCQYCYGQKSESDRERYRERELQMRLAKARGEEHIGPTAVSAQTDRMPQKRPYPQLQEKKLSGSTPNCPSA